MLRFPGLMCLFSGLLSVSGVSGQGFQVVFPGLSGPDLIDSVSLNYRPAVVLDYANARDTLYTLLASGDDSLRCIYSGHTLYLDPTQDPTVYVFQSGGTNGINAEHSYPQSKGATAGTNAHSDMHHLYPTRIALNDARGDKPFAEVPDQQTQKWFINNQVFTSTPTQHIERYAESGSGTFEPRETTKGDIARSIFYFYTVYRGQANTADPNFFELQRATLCQWNAQDPADSIELRKTWRIAHYQEGKPNPFVIDCSLAPRSWCPDVAPACLSATHEPAVPLSLDLHIVPQPSSGNARVYMTLPFSGNIQAKVFSLLGQALSTIDLKNTPAGKFELPIDVFALVNTGAWLGFLEISVSNEDRFVRQIIPLMVTR